MTRTRPLRGEEVDGEAFAGQKAKRCADDRGDVTAGSAAVAIHLDTTAPSVVPAFNEPSDGLWHVGDEISLLFDEELRCADADGAPVRSAFIALDGELVHDRLAALASLGRIERVVAEDLGEALSLFCELRLRAQLAYRRDDARATDAPDRVVVQSLNSLERDLLREALHLVKEFKASLSHRYHLEYA